VQKAYLYVAFAPAFQSPTLVPTPTVKPVALSRQASGTGSYLVFLGQAANGAYRPYVVRGSDFKVEALGGSAPARESEPALSADDSQVAIVDAAGRILVVPNPLLTSAASAPSPVLSGVIDQQTLTEGNNNNVTLQASAPAVSGRNILSLAIELDGQIVASQSSTPPGDPPITSPISMGEILSPGTHTLRALATTDQNVPGASAPVTVTVVPAAGELLLAGAYQLQRTGDFGQATTFSANVRVVNTRSPSGNSTASGALQLLVTEIPFYSTWEGFDDGVPPDPSDPGYPQEQIIGTFNAAALPDNQSAQIAISGTTVPAIVLPTNPFEGFGWQVRVQLQEMGNDGTWADSGDPIDLFQVLPVLNEQTPGPNGGPVVPGSTIAASKFQGATLTGLTISGLGVKPGTLAEFSSGTYVCTANYTLGNSTTASAKCSPVWSIIGGGAAASVSPSGVVTGKRVATPHPVTLQAAFGGQTATFPLTVVPVSPVISVLAKKAAAKPDTSGSFRIMRTPLTAGAVDVTYTVAGTAFPGTDYTALTGSATIPQNASFVDVAVSPLSTAFTGTRSVTVTVQPDGAYRLAAAHSATVLIADQAPQDGQPDAVIQAGSAAPVGASVYFPLTATEAGATTQVAAVTNGIAGHVSTFTISAVNRTTSPQTLTVQAYNSGIGYTFRYLNGRTDVTAEVEAGTFQFPTAVAPGSAASLKLQVTPSSNTPLGQTAVCAVTVSTSTASDVVEATVRRAR
jgi:hypothetical protein